MPLSPWARDRVLLVLLAACLFLPGLGSRDLWNPDEPRYAEVAREMLDSGQFFVPHLNGKLYKEKPPLQFWSIAFFGWLRGGVDETAARLPAALAAIATVLLVFELGRRLVGRQAAWLAALTFATSGKILWQGRIGQIDMLLIFWVTLAMFFFVRGWLEKRPGFYRLFFLAAGMATLAKGPVGLLPPLLSVLAFLLVSGDRAEIKKLRLGTGLLLWAAVVLLWLVPAGLVGGREYLEPILFKQNVTRYVDPWHHHKPWYYYLTVIPGDFFPWSFLLPGALVAGWKRLDGEARRAFLLGLCWMVVTIVFFSLSPAKRTVYVLTMYPGMALLVGVAFDRLFKDWPRGQTWFLAPLALQAALFTAAVALVPKIAAKELPPGVFPAALPATIQALAGGLAVAFGIALALAWWQRPRAAFATVAGGFGAAALALVLLVLPEFDRVKSARQLTDVLREHAGSVEPYAIYPLIDPQVVFYAERFAELPANEDELHAYVRRPGRVWLFIERKAWEELSAPPPLVQVAHDQDLESGYLLLATAPSP